MPAARPAKRRTTETTSLKLFLTAATLSLTIGGWGAISHAARDADLDATTTTDAATADFDLDLAPLPRLIVPAAPPAAIAPAPRIVAEPPAAAVVAMSQPAPEQQASPAPAAPAAKPAARTKSSR